MPVNTNETRLIALALPGVEESVSHGTLAFYVRGKLLARLQEDGDFISIGCSGKDRVGLINQYPNIFFLTDHFQNYDYILLNMTSADVNFLGMAFEAAWRRRAPQKDIVRFDSTSCYQSPNERETF